jgi:hypothetical protein
MLMIPPRIGAGPTMYEIFTVIGVSTSDLGFVSQVMRSPPSTINQCTGGAT